MIDPDLRFSGFEEGSWRRLLALFTPDHAPRGPEDGVLLVVQDERGDTIFARHSVLGRVRHLPATEDPDLLRQAVPCRYCVLLSEDALAQLEHRTTLRLSPDQDYLEQMSMLAHGLRETLQARQIRVSPPLPDAWPIPSGPTLVRALDLALPIGRTAVLCTFDGLNIDTALILRRGPRGIDTVLGRAWLTERVGPLGGDFRRDHHRITEVVGAELGALAVGIFAETELLHGLLRSPDPGAFATAAATRELIVSPMPPYAAVALGADAIRSVARASGLGELGRDLVSALSPVARALLDAVDARTPTSVLGFNPLLALSKWLARHEKRDDAEFFDRGASDP